MGCLWWWFYRELAAVSLSSSNRFSDFQLIVSVLQPATLLFQFSVNVLINPLHAGCSAPDSRQKKLETSYILEHLAARYASHEEVETKQWAKSKVSIVQNYDSKLLLTLINCLGV